MCNECKNQEGCPFKETYDFLCKPLVESINDGLEQDDIFTMELKCNFKNKSLPYTVEKYETNPELDEALDNILKKW